jgi:probable HAF family extracellular repeat protein
MKRVLPAASLTIAAILSTHGLTSAQPVYPRIYELDSTVFSVERVSRDGSVVVGAPAFHWTPATGLTLVQPPCIAAFGANFDGSVLAGYCWSNNGNLPFRWSAATGLQMLHPYPINAVAEAVNADGSVIVGGMHFPYNRAFRWTAATGVVDLGTPPNLSSSWALAVSADGTVIVGAADRWNNSVGGFRWTPATGMQPLELLPGCTTAGALAVSADGLVIAGLCAGTGYARPVIWMNGASGVEPLPLLPGAVGGSPRSVNADGTVIAGNVGIGSILWIRSGASWQIVPIRDVIAEAGVNLAGWTLSLVRGMSDDARTFAGSGTFLGQNRHWVAILSGCYANCDASTTPPILNIEDFTCFISDFAAASQLPHNQQLNHYANCDHSNTAPVLNVEDFACFINKFAAGCD